MTTHLLPAPKLETFPMFIELTGRKAYGARLIGPDKRYGIEREFTHRRQSLRGQRGLWAQIEKPGWYETVTYRSPLYRRDVSYWAITGQGEIDQLGDQLAKRWLTTLITGPPPGRPGAWWGDRCPDGNPATDYTPDLWPRCDECGEPR